MNITSTKNATNNNNIVFAVFFVYLITFIYSFYCIIFSCDLLREYCNNLYGTNYTFEFIFNSIYTYLLKKYYFCRNRRGYNKYIIIQNLDSNVVNVHDTIYSNEEIDKYINNKYINDKNYIIENY